MAWGSVAQLTAGCGSAGTPAPAPVAQPAPALHHAGPPLFSRTPASPGPGLLQIFFLLNDLHHIGAAALAEAKVTV